MTEPETPVPDPRKEAVWTRLILPFALPIISAIAVGLWATNLSRVFLASGKDGALVVVLIVTVTIMVGAASMSAMSHMRSSSQTMLVATAVVVLLSAGFISISPSEEHKASGPSGYQEPKAAATGTLEVDALPSLSFQAKTFSVAAGVIQLDYVDQGGTHTLDFDTTDPNLKQLQLNVPSGKHTAKVELKAGTYTIYCAIPGHRAAGMEATITVQ